MPEETPFINIDAFPICPGFGSAESEIAALRNSSLKARGRAHCESATAH